MRFRKVLSAAVAVIGLGGATLANALTVDATTHSWNGGAGSGLDTGLALSAGQQFTVNAGALDYWSAGGPYRISNAAGLTGDSYVVAGDEIAAGGIFAAQATTAGYATSVGSQIGQGFGLLASGGLSAPYGALVGRVGLSGALFQIGLGGTFTATSAGNLTLFYWDTTTTDNFGSISAAVAPVPLPAAAWLLLSGLGGLGLVARRRHRAAA